MKCDSCKQSRESVKLREKLDPTNLRSIQQRMCTPCARREGWRDVTFSRGHAKEANSDIGRRAYE